MMCAQMRTMNPLAKWASQTTRFFSSSLSAREIECCQAWRHSSSSRTAKKVALFLVEAYPVMHPRPEQCVCRFAIAIIWTDRVTFSSRAPLRKGTGRNKGAYSGVASSIGIYISVLTNPRPIAIFEYQCAAPHGGSYAMLTPPAYDACKPQKGEWTTTRLFWLSGLAPIFHSFCLFSL